jgi:hypothetical protein
MMRGRYANRFTLPRVPVSLGFVMVGESATNRAVRMLFAGNVAETSVI